MWCYSSAARALSWMLGLPPNTGFVFCIRYYLKYGNLGAAARATQIRRIMVLTQFFGSSPQKLPCENNLSETNKRALKTKPNPITDPPLLLQAKFPFDTALSSPSPLLSLHPAPQLATCKKRLHHGHTQQVNAQHRSTLPMSGEISSDLQKGPLQLFPLHISTTHTTWNHHSILFGDIILHRILYRALFNQGSQSAS